MIRMPLIQEIDTTLDGQIQMAIDQKTKPLGALGKLEKIAFQIAQVQRTLNPVLTHPSCIVFAGDHGITAESVSAYPAEVTTQMVMNFIRGGAAINVFCKQHNIELSVVDSAVQGKLQSCDALINFNVMPGTANAHKGLAMNKTQLSACFQHGFNIVEQKEISNFMMFGEMGIGNTTSAALIMGLLTDIPIEDCVGRGTGLDDFALNHKLHIIQETLQRHESTRGKPLDVLQAVGGCEINMMCAAMLQAAADKKVILVDGFIATAAALAASKINPHVLGYCIFAHQSDESGHRHMLEHLQAEPVLKLDLRLGEGSGAALAYPLIQSAVLFLNDMATFASASVSTSHQEKM